VLRATEFLKCPSGPFIDEVVLDYDDRHRRRVMMRGEAGTRFLLDLADAADMRDGDGLVLTSGLLVRVRAADEALIEISCADPCRLARIAWHIGNRHLAAEIGAGTIRVRADHVIADMARRLGGAVRPLCAAFNPERGAYAGATAEQDHYHG
jgi:urease accessory protein